MRSNCKFDCMNYSWTRPSVGKKLLGFNNGSEPMASLHPNLGGHWSFMH